MNQDKQSDTQNNGDDIMTDNFLSQLLAYREQLIDHEFIERLARQIDKLEQRRFIVITFTAILGLVSLWLFAPAEWFSPQLWMENSIAAFVSDLTLNEITAIVFALLMASGCWMMAVD